MTHIKALTFDAKTDGWEKSKGFVMREIPTPVLGESDAQSVIIQMRYAGFCGSDRSIWNRKAFRDLIHSSLESQGKNTRILGHEFFGEVIEVGPAVLNVRKGDLVSGDSHITCGECYQCKNGQNNVCVKDTILGISIDGIFAQQVKIPAKNLWKVDIAKVKPEIATIYDPFGNAVHAVSKIDAIGKDTAVFGAGPIGLFTILLLKYFGAKKIIVGDVSENNLSLAKDLGADKTILIPKSQNQFMHESNKEFIKEIIDFTNGKGVDLVFEMAGPNSSVNNALESVRRGGEVILFGLRDGDFIIPKFSRLIVKGLTIHGVIGRQIFDTWKLADEILKESANGIAQKIWKVILREGNGTVINFTDYDNEKFEKTMNENPKIIFKF